MLKMNRAAAVAAFFTVAFLIGFATWLLASRGLMGSLLGAASGAAVITFLFWWLYGPER
jgi:hypothetical protein